MNRAILILLTCSMTVATACSDDDEPTGSDDKSKGGRDESKRRDDQSKGGADGGVDSGVEGGGSGDGSGVLIHTAEFTPDGTSTLLYVVDELTPDLVLDPATALELSGQADVSVPPPGMGMRSFFVGLGEEPTIRRYDVDDDGRIAVGGELSLQGLGAKDAAALISGLSFISKNRAYFIDVDTLQVIVIDPEKMEIVSDFPLTGIAEPDLNPPSSWYKNIDGDRIIVAFAFDRIDDTPSPLSKIAIIDTTDDTVVYDEQSRCGYLCWTARDVAGNIYFVSHTYVAIQNAAGLGGDPTFSPCMVRMLRGADGFDPDYYVDLYELAGRPVGALMGGADGIAYTLVYSESADPLTPDNVDAAFETPEWEHYSLELGNEAATFADVPGVGAGIPYSGAGPLKVDGVSVPYVTSVAKGFSETTIYDATDPSAWKRLAKIPNYIYGVHDLP